MFRRALAPAAAVLLLATACSGRANDLDTYYDEPTTDAVRPTLDIQAAPPTRVSSTTTAPTTTTPPAEPAAALLTTADLEGEGVVPAFAAGTGAPTLAECHGTTALAVVGTVWRYPSGSVLIQSVESHTRAAAQVESLREREACVAESGDVVSPGMAPAEFDGVDAQFSWCFTGAERRGCAVAVAEGPLLTVVVVEAGSTDRARAAVTRIAPLAAAALDGSAR